jgi:hypothetical protein
VSNVAAGRPSKDDSSLQAKGTANKPSQHLEQRRSMALLRPAQKGLKTIASAVSGTKTSAIQSLAENSSSLQPLKRTFNKRPTTIFKDNPLSVVQETDAPATEPAQPNVTRDDNISAPAAPVLSGAQNCVLPPPVAVNVQPEPTKDFQEIHSDTSLPGIEEVSLEPPVTSETISEYDVKQASVTVSEYVPKVSLPQNCGQSLPQASITTHAVVSQKEHQPMAVAAIINPVENIPPLSPHHSYPSRPVEPEEYWDEEEDDNEEEEGYVTARSFRSKGDNTTGGTTAVLFPCMNQRARKEIAAATQLVEATRTPEEVEDESFDTSMVAEYGDEIFDYMKQLEVKMLPNAHYMDNQHEIQWSMRSVLMDWLVQVHLRFNLLPETLFLTVNYIDRFLSCKVVSLGKLQLVGATAIFIAAKYEEINCPSVQEIVYMVDGGYSIDEVLKAERFMLTMLQFELGWPGPMSFLRRISKADDYDLETRTLAKYFLEVTLMDERFIGSPPSFTAAASHCLARVMLRKGSWVGTEPLQTKGGWLTDLDSAPRLLLRLHILAAQTIDQSSTGVL